MAIQPYRTKVSIEEYLVIDRESIDARYEYQECLSIEEYMLVDTERRAVYLYRRKTENLWVLQLFGPDDRVELESVGGIFSVEDIYEHTMLPEGTTDEP